MSEIKSKNNTRNTQTPQKVEFKRPSLSQAMEIEVTLKSCKKFELNDRAVFARNIGSLVAKEIKKNTSLTVHKIFQRAFGNTAESLYKKRKSLITLPQEASPQDSERQDLRSKARDYLEIITTLSIIKSEYSEESQTALRQKLILRLVENSSFDDQRKIKDRMHEESLSHLKEQMAKIVDRITNEVDLDYQFAWYENYLPEALISCEHFILNNTAPSVKIVDIMKRMEITKHAFITLTRDEINSAGSRSISLEASIRRRLFQEHAEISYSEEDLYILEDCWSTDEFEQYARTDKMFPKLEFLQSKNKYGVSEYLKKSSIFLEVRFDRWSDKWRIIASWKAIDFNVQVGVPGQGNDFDFNDVSDVYFEDQKALDVVIDYDTDKHLMAAEYGTDDEGNITYILFLTEGDDWCLDFGELRGLGFIAPWDHDRSESINTLCISDIYDFLMSKPQTSEEHEEYEMRDKIEMPIEYRGSISNFTPAPRGSFADKILKNLAYVTEENRIDNLLLKDAKQKNKAFKAYEKKHQKNYFDGLKKFE